MEKSIKGKCNKKNLSFLTFDKIYDLYFDNQINNEIIYAVKDDTGAWIQWTEKDFNI